MRTKPASGPERIGDFLKSDPELSDEDRESVGTLEPEPLERTFAKPDRLASDPALVAFTVLAFIAAAATLALLAQW